MKKDLQIERKILIAALTSTDYLHRVRQEIKENLLKSEMAELLMILALEFYDENGMAAGLNIEDIYFDKLKQGLIPENLAEEIENDILPGLAEQYKSEGIDIEYITKETLKHFKQLKLEQTKDDLAILLERGEIEEAENLLNKRKSTTEDNNTLDLTSVEAKEAVRKAFTETYTPLITFSGALGKFWNRQMVRGGFIALLSPEKRGKTMLLKECGLMAAKQGRKVAFFQAGDMSEGQMLRRMVLNISKRTDREEYTGKQYIPVKDCIRNQLNTCHKEIRECQIGALEHKGWQENEVRQEICYDDLVEAYRTEKDYRICFNCSDFEKYNLGSVFVKEENIKLITTAQAERIVENWFAKKNRQIRLSTHANGTLSVKIMKQIIDTWESRDGWIPDVIIVDYADLLVSSDRTEFRHQQNQIWKDLRGLNQQLDCLLITATQSDAGSYEKDTLNLKNFSEDKRKYAHTTFFAGLNADTKGREKKMGVMRINELIARESSFDSGRQVYILQDLNRAMPILASFF
jgi:hypothetical protein